MATWQASRRGARFAAWLQPIVWNKVLPGAWNTIVLAQIALVGMGILALLLFPLVSRQFVGPIGQPAGRVLLVVVRSTPEYMLAYVLLQLLGPSMLPAIIALAVHNGAIVGYLMGRHADALDYRADAPKGLNLYAYDTTPRLYGQFLAYSLYRWEIIVRESAIFGILGVATLGYYVDAAISELRFDVAVVLILATVGLCALIDALSRRLRQALAHLDAGNTARRRAGKMRDRERSQMQTAQTPVLKDIVLVGAGHSHVGVLRMFGMDPMPGVRLTLVTRQVHTPYSGMLPGMIAGLYDHDAGAHRHRARSAASPRRGSTTARSIGLDLAAKRVICRDRPPVPYDILSINIGSTPSARQIPGVAEHAIPVKPIDGFIERFEAARTRVLEAQGPRPDRRRRRRSRRRRAAPVAAPAPDARRGRRRVRPFAAGLHSDHLERRAAADVSSAHAAAVRRAPARAGHQRGGRRQGHGGARRRRARRGQRPGCARRGVLDDARCAGGMACRYRPCSRSLTASSG